MRQTPQWLNIAFVRFRIANMETDKVNNLSLPLILKYCFKDIKQVDGSDVNVSAVCNVCSKTIKGSVTSTTNFLKHLKIKGHSDLLQNYENVKNTTLKKRKLTEISSSCASGSESTFKKLKQSTLTDVTSGSRSVNLDKLIVQFIVDTMSPVSIGENKYFKALIEGSQQLTKPPKVMCRITAKNKINNEYNELKKNLKLELDNVEFVCSTADIWSSSKRSYLGVTVHWIESETFERKSAAIACRRFKGAHTYDKVAEIIADIHSDYNLKLSKIVKTVTDNGSNMVKAFEVFGKSDSEAVENEHVSHAFGDVEKSSIDEGSEDDDSLLVLQAFPDASSD
ncbi:uncharacterized protein LOC123701611 [Colias croceus]|uniref:uncharacterized protein LOC123701611 n=1 Tax=Colias crocea TaxID=72248 RepID=UPI001E27C0B7|nr:uncharacterized protein LOC123701611 [Colias croceus]